MAVYKWIPPVKAVFTVLIKEAVKVLLVLVNVP